jgi:peptidoglycan/xylan/chitin deacetylase (PgdA/CDA1 family)
VTRASLLDLSYRLLRASRLPAALASLFAGIGTIFSLHALARPDDSHFGFEGFSSADFLGAALDWLVARDYRVVSLDELHARLSTRSPGRKLVCFTFDDGYRDNLDIAWPMFQKRGLPLTIYVATDFIDRKALLWTYALREIVLAAPEVSPSLDGRSIRFPTDTYEKKRAAFAAIKGLLARTPGGTPEENFHRAFAGAFDPTTKPALYRMFMSWDDLRRLSLDPLVTIGSHSTRHVPLSGLSDAAIESELKGSRARIESEIGKPVQHFAYPFGSRREVGRRELNLAKAAGYKTMTTARLGAIFPEHAYSLHALPRIPFNAALDQEENLEVLLSGLPSVLLNRRRAVTF